MKLFKGYIEEVDQETFELTVSMYGKRADWYSWVKRVVPFNQYGKSMGIKLGLPCICAVIEDTTFMLGTYEEHNKPFEDINVLDCDEQIMWAGETRGLITKPNGDIGLIRILDNGDGTTERNPILYYDKLKEQIKMSADNIILGAIGAGSRGNFIIEKDVLTGNIAYIFEGKTNINDRGSRFRIVISNPIVPTKTNNTNIIPSSLFSVKIDTTPSNILPTDTLESKSVSIDIGNQSNGVNGITISYENFCDIVLGSMLSDPKHLFSIKTATGSSINLKNDGEISVMSPVNNGITIKPDGSISVTSVAGVSISIDVAGNINMSSAGTIDVKATEISLHGLINLNTALGASAFTAIVICPLTGAIHTMSTAQGLPSG